MVQTHLMSEGTHREENQSTSRSGSQAQVPEAQMENTPDNQDEIQEKKFRLGVPRLKKGNNKLSNYGKNKLPGWSSRNGLWTWILFGVAVILLVSIYSRPDFSSKEIPYSDFKTKIRSGEIKKVVISPNIYKGFTEEVPEKGSLNHLPITYYVTMAVTEDA